MKIDGIWRKKRREVNDVIFVSFAKHNCLRSPLMRPAHNYASILATHAQLCAYRKHGVDTYNDVGAARDDGTPVPTTHRGFHDRPTPH